MVSKMIWAATIVTIVSMGPAHAQSVSISPSGTVRIGSGNDSPGAQGKASAPGQLKKEYGGSATDYAPGQQGKGSGAVININDGDRGGKSQSGGKANAKGKDK